MVRNASPRIDRLRNWLANNARANAVPRIPSKRVVRAFVDFTRERCIVTYDYGFIYYIFVVRVIGGLYWCKNGIT